MKTIQDCRTYEELNGLCQYYMMRAYRVEVENQALKSFLPPDITMHKVYKKMESLIEERIPQYEES